MNNRAVFDSFHLSQSFHFFFLYHMKFIAIAALFAVAQQASAYVPIAGCLQNHTGMSLEKK